MTLFAADEPPPRRVKCGAGCGHWLTDPKSIALGAGPNCAQELGLLPPTRPRIPARTSTALPEPIPLEDTVTALDALLEALSASKTAMWTHARIQHLKHSPDPEYPTEYLACLLEPCKTVREAIEGGDRA